MLQGLMNNPVDVAQYFGNGEYNSEVLKISHFFAIPCDTLHIRQSFVTDAGLLDKEEVKKKINQSHCRPGAKRVSWS